MYIQLFSVKLGTDFTTLHAILLLYYVLQNNDEIILVIFYTLICSMSYGHLYLGSQSPMC